MRVLVAACCVLTQHLSAQLIPTTAVAAEAKTLAEALADHAPYVCASGAWGPKAARTWAVAYDVWLGYHGVGGSAVVIDAYVSENGSARLAGRGGGEMSGHVPEAEQLSVGQVDTVTGAERTRGAVHRRPVQGGHGLADAAAAGFARLRASG